MVGPGTTGEGRAALVQSPGSKGITAKQGLRAARWTPCQIRSNVKKFLVNLRHSITTFYRLQGSNLK